MRLFALSLAAAVALCPASSWAQSNGAEAFAARDFATAEALWQQEAAAGSSEAMLGLGLLADRGYGMDRDLGVAYDWYAEAADLGNAEAQFNLAIMHDAGLGRPRDAGQAYVWYTRAALRGHARAQYNLGLLLESGDGVRANPLFAAYWFDKAAETVPAAAEKTAALSDPTGGIAAPYLSFAQAGDDGAELIWNADPAAHPNYLVEVLDGPDMGENYAAPVLAQSTTAPGLLTDNVTVGSNAFLRVINIAADSSDYAASAWAHDDGVTPPKGRITLFFDPQIDGMSDAASIFADDLQNAGYWVRLSDEPPVAVTDFYISYGYASDQTSAQVLATYLPSPAELMPVKQVLNATQPGEIMVNLAAFQGADNGN